MSLVGFENGLERLTFDLLGGGFIFYPPNIWGKWSNFDKQKGLKQVEST